ncbi:hypothetical protein HRbin07_00264 [bacterium HR07]|nr:hypothetical protein HRbin07_00264 [bacterium HR07]
MVDFDALAEIALVEFPEIVGLCKTLENKLRVYLRDNSYIDFWWGMKLPGKFAYHWERRALDGKIFRHDNIPDARWKRLATFPKHFHSGHESAVEESSAPAEPEEGLRFMLRFARDYLRGQKRT